MRPKRPCINPGCGRLHRNPGARCGNCERAYQKARNQRRPQYAGSWQATSRQARKAEPWCHCDLPGHGHDGRICGTTEIQLTLDHQYQRVECRSCNSAHRRNR